MYLILIFNILTARLSLFLSCRILSLIPLKKNIDIGIYLHSPKYSDGYFRRFEYFFESLNKRGIKFKIYDYFDESKIKSTLLKKRSYHYILYIQILWKRVFQVLKSKKCRSIFLQRNLFPLYPDYKIPFFEKAMRKLNENITLDIWDPTHLWNPALTFSTFKYVDKISVNTPELKEDFSLHFPKDKIYVWPIAVKPSLYNEKKSYAIGETLKLFYTGSPGNLTNYLNPILPILEKINKKKKIELYTIGSLAPKSEILRIIHNKWDKKKLMTLIEKCDYGLYPNFNNEKNYTVAGKVLDYMTSGLPVIGANYGLPKNIDHERSIFTLNSFEDWELKLDKLLLNENDRKEKAEFSRSFVKEELSIEKAFNIFINIIEA